MPAPDQFQPAPAVQPQPPDPQGRWPGVLFPDQGRPPVVALQFADGRPLFVNPAYVVSVHEALESDRVYVDQDGPLCALLLAHAPSGWLVRGTVDELTEKLWP